MLAFLQKSEPLIFKNMSYAQSAETAKIRIFRAVQQKRWGQIINGLQNFKDFRCPVDQKSDFKALKKVSAFLDKTTGLVKCFGRHADVEGEFISDKTFEKIVLPDKNVVTKKLILSVHEDLQHIGQVTVNGFLGRDYWILRSLQYVTNVVTNCKPCLAQKALSKNEQMSVLPRVHT